MIKSLRRFAGCVESLRMAEKEYEKNKTDAQKQIVRDLQEKVDAWLKWIREREDEELATSIPPFIRNRRVRKQEEGSLKISDELIQTLTANHTKEEIQKFLDSINKPFYT